MAKAYLSREGTCKTPDCDRAIYARRLCRAHYEREWRKANPEKRATYDAKRRQPETNRTCPECGEQFMAAGRSKKRFCSRRCARRAENRRPLTRAAKKRHRREWRARHGQNESRDRKRARRFGVAYEPISREKVFERDGWRCQICRKLTKKSGKYPDPRAPTLDHILPMSQGGPHLYVNVQCSCWSCNEEKNAGAANDRLRLFG